MARDAHRGQLLQIVAHWTVHGGLGGFNSDLVGYNRCLMGFNGELMGYTGILFG